MERVLLVQVEESAARKIKKLAEAKKISVVYGTKEQGSQIIQDILDGKENPYASENALPRNGLVVFCGLSEKHLDSMLFDMRRKNISVDYKAVLTPTNVTWTLQHLYLEMEMEERKLRNREE